MKVYRFVTCPIQVNTYLAFDETKKVLSLIRAVSVNSSSRRRERKTFRLNTLS